MKVLITGATSGIGFELTNCFAKAHKVIACGRNRTQLQLLERDSKNITGLEFDINDKHEVAKIGEMLPNLDLIIFNAGTCEYINDVSQFDGALFERVINTNLISVGYCLQHWLKHVNKGGQIAFVSSSATIQPFPRAEAYGASKAGLSYLANSIRMDLKPMGIDVCLIEPGFVETPLTDKNEFSMPFIVSSQSAALEIYDGLFKRKDVIRFPFQLITLLKLFNFLPKKWWLKLMQKGQS